MVYYLQLLEITWWHTWCDTKRLQGEGEREGKGEGEGDREREVDKMGLVFCFYWGRG